MFASAFIVSFITLIISVPIFLVFGLGSSIAAIGGLNLPCKTILNVFSSGTYASTCHVKSRFKTKIASNAMDSPFPFLFEMFLFSLSGGGDGYRLLVLLPEEEEEEDVDALLLEDDDFFNFVPRPFGRFFLLLLLLLLLLVNCLISEKDKHVIA